MRMTFDRIPVWRCASCLAAMLLAAMATGCATAAVMGVKVVGNVVQTVDVDTQSKQLLGQPPARADAEVGRRLAPFEDTRSKREMMTYTVQGDVLDQYRWVVEVENNRIVALAKAQFNADGGKDIIKKALLKDKVIGKTPTQIQADDHFKSLTLVLRNRATGNLARAYDITGMTDLLGARYCVLDFDKSDRCTDIRLVGVPSSAGSGAIAPRSQ